MTQETIKELFIGIAAVIASIGTIWKYSLNLTTKLIDRLATEHSKAVERLHTELLKEIKDNTGEVREMSETLTQHDMKLSAIASIAETIAKSNDRITTTQESLARLLDRMDANAQAHREVTRDSLHRIEDKVSR
jgi:methyl-accepting chemotaxis protein